MGSLKFPGHENHGLEVSKAQGTACSGEAGRQGRVPNKEGKAPDVITAAPPLVYLLPANTSLGSACEQN